MSKFHTRQAREAADKVLEAFKDPASLPKALATIALDESQRHAARYSPGNQFLVFLFGYSDAAGYKQWLKYGRQVRKGERGFPILAPITASFWRKDEETGKDVRITYVKGWRHVTVFGVEQTDIVDEAKWAKYSEASQRNTEFVERMPWTETARTWDLAVGADGNLLRYGAKGMYTHGRAVQVAVENLSVWAHEIIHAADDRLGTLTKKPGQQPDNEVVAEVGGAVLCIAAGHGEAQADLGGCYEYCQSYLADAKDPLQAANRLLSRIINCVALVLAQAEQPDEVIPTLQEEAA